MPVPNDRVAVATSRVPTQNGREGVVEKSRTGSIRPPQVMWLVRFQSGESYWAWEEELTLRP